MNKRRCPLHCDSHHKLNRRDFLHGSALLLAGSSVFGGCASMSGSKTAVEPIRPCGPASKYVPTIKAAFVRRKEDYGMLWPGAVYDGKSTRRMYTKELKETAKALGVKLELRPEPIYSAAEADGWCAEAKATRPDGLVVMVHDRQRHSWPTARKAVETGIPTVIFSPLGTSFTTNTIHLADKPGCVIYSTDDFSQAAFGMKMLKAGAKMRNTRCVVLRGNKRYDTSMEDLGIALHYVPAKEFLDEYRSTPDTDEILAMADEYMRLARRRRGATRQDVINGIKSYIVAGNILKREECDAITMDCLGALGRTKVSLPCIAWSRMNDDGIPAACEADLGAVAAHTIVQYLFDRPGFEQDPVADTLHDAVIGAHCSCPTRLNGFDKPPEPFDIVHHHGNRDAVPRTLWRKGQRVTSLDVFGGDEKQQRKTKLLFSVGTVMDNIDVPPAGGCVVSVRVKFDGGYPVLSFPGFHQIFFYGDYKQQLTDFCRLFDFEAEVA
ncbi:MAG: hypothetical protein GWN67_00465 [Phycisphaerae bacterium]|nr:hypothetical protein [Phycisphaerae bacterium]NIP50458.1 hypothetical protein [Phycisphaerae bacterium]NIS49586.1 hypothetical protein [Phycisphaerae bacterium]NIU07344.1 hypothetical protein [Phycisphaerae bacterium]NIU54913.1 hypothetical protein [Phycisphaerae bacterium]